MAIKASIKVNIADENSLLVMWKTEPISMMAIIPDAATGVSTGLIRNTYGSNNPKAASNSDTEHGKSLKKVVNELRNWGL